MKFVNAQMALKAALVLFFFFFASCSKKENVSKPDITPPKNSTDPIISSISPTAAIFTSDLVITGNNFSSIASDNIVKINGKEAYVKNSTTTSINIIVPKGAGNGPITVEVNGKIAVSQQFTYLPGLLVSNYAGKITPNQQYVDGTSDVARFGYVWDMVVDDKDNLYVVDDRVKIRKITPNGTVTTYAGNNNFDPSIDGPVAVASLQQIESIAIDQDNTIYITEGYSRSLRKITTSGVVTTIFQNKNSYPSFVAVDKLGSIYVYMSNDKTIKKFNSSGTVLATYGPFNSLPEPISEFKIDSKGNFFLFSLSTRIIYKITSLYTVTEFAGSSGPVANIDGIGTSARFYGVNGMAVDKNDNIYVNQTAFAELIRKITPDGKVTTMFLRPNSGVIFTGIFDDKGRPVSSETAPTGKLAVDSKGNFFIGDISAFRIMKGQPE